MARRFKMSLVVARGGRHVGHRAVDAAQGVEQGAFRDGVPDPAAGLDAALAERGRAIELRHGKIAMADHAEHLDHRACIVRGVG